MIGFRPLRRDDFPLLHGWLAQPHIAVWWRQRLDLAEIEAKYGPRVEGAEPTHVFVIEHHRAPIGWIQWYRWSDYPEHAARLQVGPASAGIDLAIGEAGLLGKGLGPKALRQFVSEIVFADPAIETVVSDPEAGNRRSIRAFEKAGFTMMATMTLEGETAPRTMVRLQR